MSHCPSLSRRGRARAPGQCRDGDGASQRRQLASDSLGVAGGEKFIRAHERRWSIQTAGRWPWRPKWRRVPREQQLNVGQSTLRNRRRPFRSGAGRVNRPRTSERESGQDSRTSTRRSSPFGDTGGDANEHGDAGSSPGKSFLFSLRRGCPGIGSPGDREFSAAERDRSCRVRCARAGP